LPLWQSAPVAHAFVTEQSFELAAHTDPQSMSDSPPFLTPSEHVGGWHAWFRQTWLSQSFGPLHTVGSVHAGHEPPQSTAVSSPFCT
jgi:hypothetical protein